MKFLKLREFSLRFIEYLCSKLSIQNKVVFDNFRGRGFGDDPKYIALELLKSEHKIKLVWFVNDLSEDLPKGITKVKYGSYRAVYHLCTSRVWIDNVKNAYRTKKRIGQYYIQTWHSTLGLKQNEADIKNLPPSYVRLAKHDAAITDLMYSNNNIRFYLYKNKFWYDGLVIKSDVPRVSILFNPPAKLKLAIYSKYKISIEKKIVLYAPTLRNGHDVSIYQFDFDKITYKLSQKFGSQFIFAIRMHPGIASYIKKMHLPEWVVNMTDYPDMQELLAVTDVLITDYSGSMFDFGLVHKPCFLLAKDHDNYIANDRNLLFDISELPFSMSVNESQLYTQIDKYDSIIYADKCNKFYDSIGFHDSGNGANKIAEIVLSKMK